MIRSNHTDPAERYYAEQSEARLMAERDKQTKEPSMEELRAFIEKESKSVEQRIQDQADHDTSAAWLAQTPEYKPSDFAARQINEFLQARSLPVSIENLDAAFEHLSGQGLIETNAAAVEKKVQRRVQESALMSRARTMADSQRRYSDAELENMPLEQLRRLAFEGGR